MAHSPAPPSAGGGTPVQPNPADMTEVLPTGPPTVDPVDRLLHGDLPTVRPLTEDDLASLLLKEWGPRLMDIIRRRQWHRLLRDDAIKEALTKRCSLCDQWIGRAQDMHRHLQLYHPRYWPHVMQKSTQFTNLFASSAPCEYCGSIFVSKHKCNVWTQVSMLMLYGADGQSSVISRDAQLLCEICNEQLPSQDAMHRHLVIEHQLPSAKWNLGRDAIEGDPACSHCGQTFTSMTSLRSHIVQGRCEAFDPTLSSEPKEPDELWIRALCSGEWNTIMQVPHNRLRLTLHCQFCTKTCMRAADLSLHLQTSHTQVWTTAEPFCHLLVDKYYNHRGCVCNPSTSKQRLNHICIPLRQLAMVYARLPPRQVFQPTQLLAVEFRNLLHEQLDPTFKEGLAKIMLHQDVLTVWQDELLLKKLCTQCVLCGQHFHPAELCHHLRQAFGSQECPCIGFAGVDGTAMVRVGEHYVAYPGELGSRCAAWDDDRHPESCREGQMPGKGKGWCKQSWCYVDPRNCDLKVAPRLSEYVPTARYQNMPLFYSYATCGGEEPRAKDAVQPGCECIGIENKAGSIKANLQGVPIRYPGEVGGSCKAWDLEQNPLCAVKGAKPSFCTQKWCYVDPCKCGVKAPPKEAVYFNATMRGKTVYYSYEACGSNDTFTLGYNKNACINAKDEKACGLLPKCAWSGSSCFGKELVVPELCSADQVYNGTKVEDLRSSSWSRPMLSLAVVLTLFS